MKYYFSKWSSTFVLGTEIIIKLLINSQPPALSNTDSLHVVMCQWRHCNQRRCGGNIKCGSFFFTFLLQKKKSIMWSCLRKRRDDSLFILWLDKGCSHARWVPSMICTLPRSPDVSSNSNSTSVSLGYVHIQTDKHFLGVSLSKQLV